MRVLIDGHMLGQNEGGNERYIKNLVFELQKITNIGTIRIKNRFLSLFLIPFIMVVKRYDIFHSNYFLPLFKIPKKKYVVTIHDLSFKRCHFWFGLKEQLIFSIFVPYSLFLSDAIIVPSDFTKRELIYFYPQYKNKIFVTYMGVDTVFKPPFKILKEKKQFFLCLDSKYLRKNIDLIIRAFIKANLKDTNLYIVGHRHFSKKNQHNKVNNKIKYLGYVSDEVLKNLYYNSIALIYVSSYEGFGLPIIETLACRTSVIASDTPCHREIAGNNVAYINPNRENDLIKAIIKTAKMKKNIIDRQQKNKMNNVLRIYNWSRTAEETLMVYKKII